MKALIICLCYAAGLGVLYFFLGRLLPKRWLHPDKFPFRTYAWEEKLWKALQIRKWQAKVPDMSRLCLLYTSPSPRDGLLSRMPSSA